MMRSGFERNTAPAPRQWRGRFLLPFLVLLLLGVVAVTFVVDDVLYR